MHRELTSRLNLLAQSVQADGPRIVVYNGLPWSRSGVVEVPGLPGLSLFAHDVPPGGYKTYRLDQAERALPVLSDPPTALHTSFFQVTFDLQRGGIASLLETQTGRQLVDQSSPYALGQFLHERFDQQQMLAFHHAYGRPGYSWIKGNLPKDLAYAALTPPAWSIGIQRTSAADIATLTARDTIGLAQGITLVFTFDRQQPGVEVEWRVTGKTPDPLPEGGWLCFPLAAAEPRFLLGRLGGPIDPTREIVTGANKHYFCLSTGLTITGKDGSGIGLCPIDSSCVSLDQPGLWKFALDYRPQKPTVFVNLYNNQWNTNFPEWQDGSWSSRVRLWPTPELTRPAWEARLPLLAARADAPAGKLPPTQTGLSVSRPGVLVTAFGQNPDGPGILLRVWDQSGTTGELLVTLPGTFQTATPVDLRGEKTGPPAKIPGGRLTFELRAYAPASFVLE